MLSGLYILLSWVSFFPGASISLVLTYHQSIPGFLANRQRKPGDLVGTRLPASNH